MSIGKEVEKMYREDEEKQRRKQKKKKSGRLATIIVLIYIVILALLLAKVLGLFGGDGFGFGRKDDGGSGGVVLNNSAVSTDSSEAESSAAEDNRIYDDIKVSGSTYLYKGSETTLDDLVDTFSMEKMNKEVVARISDDNATQNSMEALTKALDDMGRVYVIESLAADESSVDTSAESAG